MSRVHKMQYNFTAGEWTPLLDGRSDLAKYNNALKTQENFINLPWGGLLGRHGSHYVAEVKTSSTATILQRFRFSTTQAYIIEIGNLYMRFYRNNGQILSSGTPVEIATPYATADLKELHFAQSADTLYIAHRNYAPRKLTRSSHTSWTLSTISFTSNPFSAAGDYPGAVTFFEERLYWAGTDNDPQKIWGSQVADYENLDPGTGQDDEAVIYTLAANEVNVIRALIPTKDLIVMTVGGEWLLTGGSDPITPTNVEAKQQSTIGSSLVSPVQVNNVSLFVSETQRKLHELVYNFDEDGYLAPDLTLLAEHITTPVDGSSGGGITTADFQKEPYRTYWATRSDGVLLSMTYLRDQNVIAWGRHLTHQLVEDKGQIESVAIIPAVDGDRDEVWVVVRRDINGAWVRYVEYLDPDLNVDSGLTYDGESTSKLTGLDHLVGETVDIVGNSAAMPQQVVASDGSLTLVSPVTTAQVGLPFTPSMTLLRPEVTGADGGSSLGKQKSWGRLHVMVYNTGSISVNGTEVPLRKTTDAMGQAVPIFTGIIDLLELGFGKEPEITISRTKPLPLTILAISGELIVSDN